MTICILYENYDHDRRPTLVDDYREVTIYSLALSKTVMMFVRRIVTRVLAFIDHALDR